MIQVRCRNFSFIRTMIRKSKPLLFAAIDEMLALLRRQYEDFENEKQRLIADFIEKEKTIRFETMRLGEEKEYVDREI